MHACTTAGWLNEPSLGNTVGGDGGWQAKLREILAEFDDDCRDLSSSCNCLGEDLAVVSPVKHCRHSGFLVSRAKCHNRSRQRGHSSQAEGFPKTIHNDPLACIIDGPDIICQEKYRKFLKKGVLCRLRGSGNSNREARSEVSGFVAAAPSISLRETNQSRSLLIFIEPRGVEGSGSRQSSERICGRLQFRWLKHELQIKHDV